MNSTSSNYAKHAANNPIQQLLIQRFYSKVFYLVKKTNPQTIFEAGCGEGFSSNIITSACHTLFIGMDININSLLYAQNKCSGCFFVQGNIFNIPFPDSTFDLAVSLEVLEHLENPSKALSELCRITNQWLILSVPHEPFFCLANFMRGKNLKRLGNDPGHINHWTKNSFKKFIEKQCIIVDTILSFPWILLLCKLK